jgi:CHAT domain-containing protein
VRPWLGEEATRGPILSRRSPRLLHLSTHGLFLPERPVVLRQDVKGAPEPPPVAWENPLYRSALALAAEAALTAFDITTMDLLGTEVVVLPACETPVTQAMAWSRVSGLLSACLQAGAGNVILSLWRAPEAVRVELVLAFYGHLLQGKPANEALRRARLDVRARHPEPRFWAGWVCVGNRE